MYTVPDHPARKPVVAPHKTHEERQVALAAALKEDPGVEHGSARAFQMYLVVLIACFCSSDSGFDATVMGGVNAMKQYQDYFGMTGTGAAVSLVFGMYTIGYLVGTIPSSILPDRYGRRFGMWFGNAVLIVGASSTALAKSRTQFILGRFITGIGGSCAGASAKSFLGELSPPQDRGLYLGILQSFFYIGQISATGMMVSTGKWQSEWSWRTPLFVQVIPAVLNVLFVYRAPESPRWLYSKGRKEEARAVLANLHSSRGDLNSPLIQLEMEDIEEKVAISTGSETETADDGGVENDEAEIPLLGSQDAQPPNDVKVKLKSRTEHFLDFRILFTDSKATRYRTFMVILIAWFGQLSGNGMVTYFLPNLLVIAGITDQTKKLTLNFINSITSFMGALTGSALIDRMGRRNLLLSSTSGLVFLLTLAAFFLSNPNLGARATAGIVMIYLFMVCFSFGWTPAQAVYATEVLPYEFRAKGLAFNNLVAQLASTINTFGLPIAFQLLGWKVILIFAFWDAIETVIIYFYLVETKGLTLEEMDDVFMQPNPRKYSVQNKVKSLPSSDEA